MMLSIVISTAARRSRDDCDGTVDPAFTADAGGIVCAVGEEIETAARKAAAIPTRNRFIDV